MSSFPSKLNPLDTQSIGSAVELPNNPGASTGLRGGRRFTVNTEIASRLGRRPNEAARSSCPNIDNLLHSFVGRNVDKFQAPGGVAEAAKALADKKNIMILTGFSVAADLPETDGVASGVLGDALHKASGAIVTFVTDRANKPVLMAAMKKIDPEMAQYARFIEFNPAHGTEAEIEAQKLLAKHNPDALIAVELPGRSADLKPDGTHIYRNMRGHDISEFNGPVDEILAQANKKGILTIGVGDGGNEAGVTGKNIPKALDGTNMANTVKSDVMVTAYNSNLGAMAIGGAVLQLFGKLDKMPSSDAYVASIQAAMDAGAVDGVTRNGLKEGVTVKSPLNAKVGDSFAGVDGFHMEVHAADMKKLTAAIQRDIPEGVAHVEKKNPFIVTGTDSSNGVFIGGKDLAGYLKYRYDEPVAMQYVADHGNAPYGDKTREELMTLCGEMQQTSLGIGSDLSATLCNTQSTTQPHSLHLAPNSPYDAGAAMREKRTINLVDVTARAVAEIGGKHPVLLSTQATKDSGEYQRKIDRYSDGEVRPGMIACPEWAPMVNDRLHESDNPQHQSMVENEIRPIVAQLKKKYDEGELSSVVLCCTHYPSLIPQISKEMNRVGLGHVPIINQIEALAEEVISRLKEIGPTIDRSKRTVADNPIVITTAKTAADLKKVEAAARSILKNRNPGSPDAEVAMLGLKKFGAEIDMQLIKEHLFPQTESNKSAQKTEREYAFSRPSPLTSTRNSDL
jgi:glutamate racemase